MSPLGSTRERPFGIYSVLMIVAAAFLALAFLVTYHELTSDYDFMGAGGFEVEEEEAAEEPAEEPAE
jgi:hypothetical protein